MSAHQSELKRKLGDTGKTQVIFAPNIKQKELINRLIDTGLWGNSPVECVKRLMDQALQTAIASLQNYEKLP